MKYFIITLSLTIGTITHYCLSQKISPSPIGTQCSTYQDCVQNSDCVYSKCQCKSGYTELSSLECTKDFGSLCTSDSECNVKMGLKCVENNTCQCGKLEEYIFDLGACLNNSMKSEYEEISGGIGEMEKELNKFNMLVKMWVIGNMMIGDDNEVVSMTGDNISPVLYQRLKELEEQLFTSSEQKNQVSGDDMITSPTTTVVTSLLDVLNQVIPTQSSVNNNPPQLESPRNIVVGPLQNPFQFFANTLNATRNVYRQIVPTQSPIIPGFTSPFRPITTTTTTTPTPTNPALQITTVEDNDLPTTRRPQLLNQVFGNFRTLVSQQFLPLIRRLNMGLSSAILRPGSSGSSGMTSQNVGTGGLFSLPLRLLQVPTRIFSAFFGSHSVFGRLTQTLFPNVDFSRRDMG